MRKILFVSMMLASIMACSDKAADKVEAPGDHATTGHVADHAKPDQRAQRELVDADGVVRRGSALSSETALTVSDVAAKAKDLDGKTIKVAGTIESVCQPMGCWFVIKGATPAENIRVSSKGHDVFMPKSSAGRDVVAEGEFKVKTVSKDMAQHMEDEREMKPDEARKVFTADVQELSLALTSVELQPLKT